MKNNLSIWSHCESDKRMFFIFSLAVIWLLFNFHFYLSFLYPVFLSMSHSEDTRVSVTRLGNILDFGQLFKAFGNNQFAPIFPILKQLLYSCQNRSFF